MKNKVLSIIFAMTLMVIPIYADVPDISNLSIDELKELKTLVDSAIFYNGGQVECPEGAYTVGEDIEEGSYVIASSEKTAGMLIAIFEDQESYKSFLKENRMIMSQEKKAASEYGIFDIVLSHGKDTTVNLNDGNILYIINDTPTIVKVDFAFAP